MEDISIQKIERVYIRLGVKILCAIVLLIGLGWGGREAFRRLQEQRLMKQALASFEKQDDRWAAIAARRVFELNPRNAGASRLLAQVMERQSHPSAVEWRRHALDVTPGSIDNTLALAKTALRFGQTAVAERALQDIGDKAAQFPVFHELKAQLAVIRKDSAAAESHFAEAARLDPQNKLYQLNLAVFHLQSSSPEKRLEASRLLQGLLDDEKLRVPAARALRDYAVQRQDKPAILDIATLLRSYPEAELRDRIFYVQVLHQMNHPDFAKELTALQEEAGTDPSKLSDLVFWMSTDKLTLFALDWVKRLPLEIVLQPPVPVAVAACYVAVNDWEGLQEWCKKGGWGRMDPLRLAYLTRALRERGQSLEARSAWAAALKSAGSDGDNISMLQQETAKWGWKDESAELLWLLTKDPSRQNAALAALYDNFSRTGQTGDLFRVAARLAELRPNDPRTMNNFAQISLLLNVETGRAHEIAQKLHDANPDNPIFASTYAYALLTRGKQKQALQVMETLRDDQLHDPPVAAYYGIILAGAGEREKAQEFLRLGATATLLPEERALVAKATGSAAR